VYRCIRLAEPVERRVVGGEIRGKVENVVFGYEALDLKAVFDEELKTLREFGRPRGSNKCGNSE
jgi:hypothetical protein